MEYDRRIENLVITGFSGTGKSAVAGEVAGRLGWDAVDTDDEIVVQAGKPIAEIFREDGEERFRELEREAIRRACRGGRRVIAIGGGAIVDSDNYRLLSESGLIICLEARPETIYQRLFDEAALSSGVEVRPLLAEGDPLERIKQLKASRQPHYARADWTVHTDALSIDRVAAEVVRALTLLGQGDGRPRFASDDRDAACMVETETRSYPVFVGYGLLDRLGEKMKLAGLSGTAVVISDENVFAHLGARVERVLRDAGYAVGSFVLPPGECTKTPGYAGKIYDYLVEHRAERSDVIVALGGGVVGDLAGFVAATYLRGISWVQMPTSLIAMVDASIGGKVGVNHPEGKNLIGAFYQPGLVLADCQALTTLSVRELISGWAEVIKHGLILDEGFLQLLEADAEKLSELQPQVLTQAIARSAAIKAGVVSRDEREGAGIRTLLNYGHTIAHGLEAATGYRSLLHGEAVAIGMMGAARLSQRLGLLSAAAVGRQQAILQRFGLPISMRSVAALNEVKGSVCEVSVAEVSRAMELDKKMKGRAIRWVLLQDIGKAVIRADVPRQDLLDVVQELVES